MQDDADAFQQAGVDALALEDVIHIGAVTVQLVGEPGHPSLLTLQLRLDFSADVYRHPSKTDLMTGTYNSTINNVSRHNADTPSDSPCKSITNCIHRHRQPIADNATHL